MTEQTRTEQARTEQARAIEDILPLSPLQEGLLFHSSYDTGSDDVYAAQLSVTVEGDLDVARLRAAAAGLVRRHPALRGTFRPRRSGEWVQLVLRDVPLRWREEDLRGRPAAEAAAAAERVLVEERTTRFDLSSAPLIRFALLRLDGDRFRFVMTNHHILLDGWSMPLVLRDLLALYAGPAAAAALPATRPYREYLGWLAGRDRRAAVAAWAGALDGLERPTLLGRRDAVPSPEPAQLGFSLDEATTAALTARARG